MKPDSIWWSRNQRRNTATEKYDNIGKDWYFRFDDGDKTIYKYTLLVT